MNFAAFDHFDAPDFLDTVFGSEDNFEIFGLLLNLIQKVKGWINKRVCYLKPFRLSFAASEISVISVTGSMFSEVFFGPLFNKCATIKLPFLFLRACLILFISVVFGLYLENFTCHFGRVPSVFLASSVFPFLYLFALRLEMLLFSHFLQLLFQNF